MGTLRRLASSNLGEQNGLRAIDVFRPGYVHINGSRTTPRHGGASVARRGITSSSEVSLPNSLLRDELTRPFPMDLDNPDLRSGPSSSD